MKKKCNTIMQILRNVVNKNPNKTLGEQCEQLIKKINENFPGYVNINNFIKFQYMFSEALYDKGLFIKGELILFSQLLVNIHPNLGLTCLFSCKEQIFMKIINDKDIEEMKSFLTLIDQTDIRISKHFSNSVLFISDFLFNREGELGNKEVDFLFDSLSKEQRKLLISCQYQHCNSTFSIFFSSNPTLIERAFYEIFDDEKILDEACKVRPYLINLRNNPPENCKVKITNNSVKALLPFALTAKNPLGQVSSIPLPVEILKIIVKYMVPQVNFLSDEIFSYVYNSMLGSNRDMGKLSKLFNLAIKEDNVSLLNNVQPQDSMKSLNQENNLPPVNHVEIPHTDKNNYEFPLCIAGLTSLIVSITLPSIVPTSYIELASTYMPIGVSLSACIEFGKCLSTSFGIGVVGIIIYNNLPNLFKNNDVQIER